MSAIASQITWISNVCSAVCSGAHQRKYQCSAWPVDSHHKGPVTWRLFPFDDALCSAFHFSRCQCPQACSIYYRYVIHILYIHWPPRVLMVYFDNDVTLKRSILQWLKCATTSLRGETHHNHHFYVIFTSYHSNWHEMSRDCGGLFELRYLFQNHQ